MHLNPLVLIAAVFFVLLAILAILTIRLNTKAKVRDDVYSRRDSVFSLAERSFFGVLESIELEGMTVLAKVRIADVVEVRSGLGRSVWQRAFNRISAKNVDFLLVRKSDGCPLLGIELDDASHQRIDRINRDRLVNAVFKSAAIPLVHIAAQHAYDVRQIHAALEKALRGA